MSRRASSGPQAQVARARSARDGPARGCGRACAEDPRDALKLATAATPRCLRTARGRHEGTSEGHHEGTQRGDTPKGEAAEEAARGHHEGNAIRGCHERDTLRAAVKGTREETPWGKPLGTLRGEQAQGTPRGVIRRRPREEGNIISGKPGGNLLRRCREESIKEQPCEELGGEP